MRFREIEGARFMGLWEAAQIKLREAKSRHNAFMTKLHASSSSVELDQITNDIDADHVGVVVHDDWHHPDQAIPTPAELSRLADEAEYKKARWSLIQNRIPPTERRIKTLRRLWRNHIHSIYMKHKTKH